MALFVSTRSARRTVKGKRPREPRRQWGTVHPHLDLHGHTGGEARLRADSWLRARQADGVRVVVVVTGRGNRSGGLPVLRGEVEDQLRRLTGTVVERFELTEGGGGFRVELRRPEPPAAGPDALAERRLREADPALRKRAEETLWELGIASTPALLHAEIQRILREEAGGGGTGEE